MDEERIVSNSPILVMDSDVRLARTALVDGFNACPRASHNFADMSNCDCDPGRIDGCSAKVEAIAKVIAAARRM
jgi:hypothetical protein